MKLLAACREVSSAEFFEAAILLRSCGASDGLFLTPLLLCEVASLRSTNIPVAAYSAEAATSAAKAGSWWGIRRRRIKILHMEKPECSRAFFKIVWLLSFISPLVNIDIGHFLKCFW